MIKDIAHIALNPLDMDKSVAFFEDVFGWEKAFELHHDNGDPWIVYMKICKGHFLELFYDGINDRDYAFDFKKTGYNHLCVTVGDIRKTLQTIYEKGYIDSPEPELEKSKCLNLWLYDPDGNGIEIDQEPKTAADKNWQAWIHDPDGNKVELMMIHPDSPQAKA